MNSISITNLCLLLLGICCFISVDASIEGWSDWSCEKQGDLCFKKRTCTSTADFTCSRSSELNITDCPCFAEWSSWGEWTCSEMKNTCLKIRYRTCIDGYYENGCTDLLSNNGRYETVLCASNETCNHNDTISEHRDGWSDWSCEKQGDLCFKSRTCKSTDDFNCTKSSEVTVTNCPCVAEWSPWGGWTCHTDQGVCLKLRKRTCISGFKGNDCLKLQGNDYDQTFCDEFCNDNDTISEHGDGWLDWSCEKQGDLCFKSRICNPTADFNCSKTSEVTVTNCPCVAEWSSWGEWTCNEIKNTCLKIRYRTCIDGYNENGCTDLLTNGRRYETASCASNETCNHNDTISEHRDGWSDWSCEKQGDLCFKSRTCNSTDDFNCTKTSEVTVTNCPCVAEWSPWGEWICHKEHGVCLQLRERTCISGFKGNDCLTLKGKHYEEKICDKICNKTNSTPASQVAFSSTTSMATTTTMELKETTVMGSGISGLHTTPTTDATIITSTGSISSSQSPLATSAATASILKPSSTQSELKTSTPSTASLSTTLNQTYILTNTATSEPYSTSKHTGALTNAYIYWLEWTEWECKNVSSSICLMSRTRNCSTYKTDDCEKKLGGEHFHVEPCRKEICPVNWSEWSDWTCRIEKDGACRKTRSRKCSTGSDTQCGLGSLERKSCDNVTCPELNELGQLGYCKGLDSSSCLDAEMCKKQGILLICLTDDTVAKHICPKTCGCCHVDPKWSSWSDWRCERTKTMCRMKQSRTCSTGNTTDCDGISVREAVCDESLCPEPTWDSWSVWKCQLRPNNTCTMSRSRTCSNEDFCNGVAHEEDVCSSEMCPDFVEFKVDCSLHNTKSHACVDGAGCHYFKNTPKTLCVDDAVACPVTCGCCIPSISSGGATTLTPPSGNSSIGITTNNSIGKTTQNPPDSGGNGSTGSGTGSGVTTNSPIGVTTQTPSGSVGNGSNGTGSGVITNSPIGVTTQNSSGSGGNGSNGTGSGVTTNNPIVISSQNPSGSGGNGSYGTGSEVTTNNQIGVTTQNPSGSGGNGSNGTGSGVITNNPIGVTTQNPSGSGGSGSNGTGSGVTTNNPIGVITQNPSGSSGNGSNETNSGVTTNNPIGLTTDNSPGSGGNGSNGTGSGVTTNNPIGVTTQNPSGSGGNSSNGTGSGVTTNNPISVITQNPSGSSGNGSNETNSGVTTNNPIGLTTENPPGSGGNGSNGTGSGATTNYPLGVTTQNPSGSGGNSSNGTGSGVTTNNPISVVSQNPSGSSSNGSNGTDSEVTTNNPIGLTTQKQPGSGGNGSNGTGSGVTTNNQIGASTQNPQGSGGNGSIVIVSGGTTNNPIDVATDNPSGSTGKSTSSGGTTNTPIGGSTQNPAGSAGNGTNSTSSGATTYYPLGVSTQSPPGAGRNSTSGSSSGVITTIPVGGSTQNPHLSGVNGTNVTPSPSVSGGNSTIETGSANVTNSTSHTVAPTPAPTKTTTTTQKQPHTPTPAAVTCNVCAGPEFLCEKLFAPQTCSPPNNYCINKLTNHIDGTRMVTRHCGNFDTCYREWFLGSSDSDKCRNFEDNNIITLDFDCTYCCTSDNCNKPIKPLDKDLYKDL